MSLEDLRQRAQAEGFARLDDVELLALTVNIDISLAQYIMDFVGGLEALLTTTPDELRQIDGIGTARAISICAGIHLGKRILTQKIWQKKRVVIERPTDAASLIIHQLTAQLQEELVVILLDAHNGVMDVQTVYIGSLNATVVRVAEVFRPAIVQNAAGMIVAHNHPSGDIQPSPQDVSLTETLVNAGRHLDIPILDHLIIASGQWLSMREKKLGF
ncbi:MAG: DNA repair protein RadC [Chloroflexi bacterium]|nr:DNA repair protein RadC [Chloroflexota bacterium]